MILLILVIVVGYQDLSQYSMIQELKPTKERSALAGDYFILSLNIPSVLVECGFISNPNEEKLLLTEAYQRRVAKAIRDGIVEYASIQIKETNAISALVSLE